MNTIRELSADESGEADALRAMMVGELRSLGAIASEPVADAVRVVARHLFAPPDEPLERIYAPTTAIVTKRDERGAATSSLSESHIQATMLEQAEIRPGMRVLEIGTGGYNAALIAELVGEAGHVTSVDIDADIVANARTALAAAGLEVNVVLADAEYGVPDAAPFDRIIVTAGTWDIPRAWIDQLTVDGRIVVPLRMRGLTRSVAFDRDGDRLVSRSYRLCEFVPMRGDGAHTEHRVSIDGDEIGIRVDSPTNVDDASLGAELSKALVGPRVQRWSGVRFDQVDQLDFYIGTSTPEFGLLVATEGPITRGLVGPAALRGVPTLVRAGSLAYRTKRPILGTEDFETGVIAHGPQAEALAEEFVSLLTQWDRQYRYGGAQITVCPAATADADLPRGLILEKNHTRVVVSWP